MTGSISEETRGQGWRIRFAGWLKGKQESEGMKTREYGDLFGVSSSTISDWTTGELFPRPANFRAICKRYKKHPVSFLAWLGMTQEQINQYLKLSPPEPPKPPLREMTSDEPKMYLHSFGIPTIGGRMVNGSADGEVTILCPVKDLIAVWRIWRSALIDVSRTTHVCVADAIALIKQHYPAWSIFDTPVVAAVELTDSDEDNAQ